LFSMEFEEFSFSTSMILMGACFIPYPTLLP
jgi:hypothetical protein